MPTFRIATFVNDERQYGEMRESFEAAGFRPPLARFTVERGEPYAAIHRLGRAEEPYAILVHQDVRCAWGDTAETLAARLAELTARDPEWALAGNAGRRLAEPRSKAGERQLTRLRHISDPHGAAWAADLPTRVISLDENMLVLRTARSPTCTPGLDGWHLYGVDAVLNAILRGCTAYVVDFRVSHLSAGNPTGFDESSRRFVERWRERLSGGEARSPDAEAAVKSAVSVLEGLNGAG